MPSPPHTSIVLCKQRTQKTHTHERALRTPARNLFGSGLWRLMMMVIIKCINVYTRTPDQCFGHKIYTLLHKSRTHFAKVITMLMDTLLLTAYTSAHRLIALIRTCTRRCSTCYHRNMPRCNQQKEFLWNSLADSRNAAKRTPNQRRMPGSATSVRACTSSRALKQLAVV